MTVKTLTEKERGQLLYVLKNHQETPARRSRSTRNLCMAQLMLEAGLRVGEVVLLKVRDLIHEGEPKGTLDIHEGIAKKGGIRQIPVSHILANILRETNGTIWIYHGIPLLSWAFKCGKTTNHLTTRQIQSIIATASMKAFGRAIHPHVLRHTFATRLLSHTNLRTIQKLLGHTSITSTQIYTHPGADELRAAIDQI